MRHDLSQLQANFMVDAESADPATLLNREVSEFRIG